MFQDTASWQIEIVDAFMEVSKSAPLTAPDGSTVTYTIWYNNTGTDTAYDFVLTESYPPGYVFVSAFPMPTSGDNIWQLGDIAPGDGGMILVNITLNAPPYVQIGRASCRERV